MLINGSISNVYSLFAIVREQLTSFRFESTLSNDMNEGVASYFFNGFIKTISIVQDWLYFRESDYHTYSSQVGKRKVIIAAAISVYAYCIKFI